MGRGYAVSAVVGILAGAFFGRVWLNILAAGLPGWQNNIKIAGWAVLTLFVVAGTFVLLRIFRTPLYWSGRLPRSAWSVWFVILIIMEVALIAIGNNFFRENKLGTWAPAWTLFIVGVHFSAFAYIFRLSVFHRLAAVMCGAAVLSVLISSSVGTRQLWFILPGLSGSIALWWFAAWALYHMSHGQWIDMKR